MHCCSAKNAVSGGSRAAAARLLLQGQQLSTRKPYGWRPLPVLERLSGSLFPASCRAECMAARKVASVPLGSRGAWTSRRDVPTASSVSSRMFVSAAAAVPLVVAAANPATIAAAARQTGALVASGGAAAETQLRVPEGLMNPKIEKGDEAADAGSSSEGQQKSPPKPSGGFPLGVIICGAGGLGCALWAASYMKQHNMNFTGRGPLAFRQEIFRLQG